MTSIIIARGWSSGDLEGRTSGAWPLRRRRCARVCVTSDASPVPGLCARGYLSPRWNHGCRRGSHRHPPGHRGGSRGWGALTDGSPSRGLWWLRRCLNFPQCREPVAAHFGSAVAAHGRALWCGVLGVAASAVWLGILRLRSLPSPRSIGDARFASPAELRALTHRAPGAWFPQGLRGGCVSAASPQPRPSRRP